MPYSQSETLPGGFIYSQPVYDGTSYYLLDSATECLVSSTPGMVVFPTLESPVEEVPLCQFSRFSYVLPVDMR